MAEIAARLGYSKSWVYTLFEDPDGSKDRARKAKYGRACERCGRLTSGSRGRPKAPRVCAECVRTRNDERNALIVERWNEGLTMREVAEALDLELAQVRGVIQGRRRAGDGRAKLHRLRNREAWPQIQQMKKAGFTNPEIAEAIGTSADSVGTMVSVMRAAGVELPIRHHDGSWRDRRRRLVRILQILEARQGKLAMTMLLRVLEARQEQVWRGEL